MHSRPPSTQCAKLDRNGTALETTPSIHLEHRRVSVLSLRLECPDFSALYSGEILGDVVHFPF